jgi:signal peptidase
VSPPSGARDSRRFVAALAMLLGEGRSVRFRAHGSSMFPAIRDGELITVAPLAGAPIRTGDIVLFRHRRGAVAHRVVGLRTARGGLVEVIARGDAAHSEDEPIRAERILGRVVAVERTGAAPRAVRGRRLSRALGHALRAGHRARTALHKLAGIR